MSGKGSGARFAAARQAAAENRAQGLDIGWTVFGYLIAGMLAYGAIGWLAGRAVHVSLLFPIGMLVGLAISIGFIIYRYGRQGAVHGGSGGMGSRQGGSRGDGFPSEGGAGASGGSPRPRRGQKGDDR